MSDCPLCRSRKGKRACPGIHGTICSACCGEKRIVEIACPKDCVYLQKGTENDRLRDAFDYLKHQDREKSLRWIQAMEKLGFLLEGIERIIAAVAAPPMDDADLRIVLECARKTFDTEAKGVLYEELPPSLAMQSVTRRLVTEIRSLTKAFEKELRKSRPGSSEAAWGAAESAFCLQVIAERCDFHLGKAPAKDSFLAHLRRLHPPAKGEPGAVEGPRIQLA